MTRGLLAAGGTASALREAPRWEGARWAAWRVCRPQPGGGRCFQVWAKAASRSGRRLAAASLGGGGLEARQQRQAPARGDRAEPRGGSGGGEHFETVDLFYLFV